MNTPARDITQPLADLIVQWRKRAKTLHDRSLDYYKAGHEDLGKATRHASLTFNGCAADLELTIALATRRDVQ